MAWALEGPLAHRGTPAQCLRTERGGKPNTSMTEGEAMSNTISTDDHAEKAREHRLRRQARR